MLSWAKGPGRVCFRVHVCVLGYRAGFFSALLRLRFHTGEQTVPSSPTGPLSSGQNKLPKAHPSCLPSRPLSGDFNHLAEAACQGPSSSSSSSLFRGAAFFVYLPPFWPKLFNLTPDVRWSARHRRTKRTPHYSAACLSCLSVFS